MKKFLKYTSSVLALSLLLTACGTTPQTGGDTTSPDSSSPSADTATPSTDGVTVTMWHYYGSYVTEELEKIVEEFHATIGKEQNITIQLVGKSDSTALESELTEAAQGVVYADAMPDIFLAYADKVLELQESDVVADLDLYFTQAEKDQLIPEFLESGVINGVQSILPVVKSTEVIYLNDTSWQEFAQVSGHTYEDLATWEGIMSTAKDYYAYTDDLTPDVPNDGKALFGMDSLGNFLSVGSQQMGTDIFDSSNNTAVLNPEALYPAYSWFVEGMSFGYMTEIGKYRSDDIRSGDILAYAGSSAGFVFFPEWIEVDGQKQDITWKAIPYPYFEEGQPYVMSQGAGACIAKKDGIQEAAAATFLKFFLEYNIDFAVDSAYIPVVSQFLEGDSATILADRNMEANALEAYDLVAQQIDQNMLYQPQAFTGSYSVRTELANAVKQSSSTLREVVLQKQGEGKTTEEILAEIDLPAQFDQTMETLKAKLESKNITVN